MVSEIRREPANIYHGRLGSEFIEDGYAIQRCAVSRAYGKISKLFIGRTAAPACIKVTAHDVNLSGTIHLQVKVKCLDCVLRAFNRQFDRVEG